MVVLNFHIFDSVGECLFSLNQPEQSESLKILYGFIYSLKSFNHRLSPIYCEDMDFFFYSTSAYHLVFYELPTSIKFVLLLSVDVKRDGDSYRELMSKIHMNIYVEFYIRRPIKSETVESGVFRQQLVAFFRESGL